MTKLEQFKAQLEEEKKDLKNAKRNNYSANIKRSIKQEIAYLQKKIRNENSLRDDSSFLNESCRSSFFGK